MRKKGSNPPPPDIKFRPAPSANPPPSLMSDEEILAKSDDGTMVRLRSYNGGSWYFKTWQDGENEPDDWLTIIERRADK